MEISAILGISSAIMVAIIGAILSNSNNTKLQLRKMKEERYFPFIEAVHHLAEDNTVDRVKEYTFCRNKLLIVGSDEVVKSIIEYGDIGIGKKLDHDAYLTKVIVSI